LRHFAFLGGLHTEAVARFPICFPVETTPCCGLALVKSAQFHTASVDASGPGAAVKLSQVSSFILQSLIGLNVVYAW